MSRGRYDVCAAVVSDLPFDARVWKQARSLAKAGHRVALVGCRYEIERTQRRTEDGVDVIEVPFGKRTGRISVLRRARTLLELWLNVARIPARSYHAHNIHVGPLAWLLAKLRRARVIYDAHELYGEPGGGGPVPAVVSRIELVLERFLVRRSDGVITTNPTRAKVLCERHGRADVTVLGNVPALAVEVNPIDPGYSKERTTLLYQGGIYAETRSFRETVEALRELPTVDFAILGFGRDHDIDLIKGWAREAGVAERVRFLPPRPFDELVRTAAAADVGLVPIKPTTLNNKLGDTNKLYEYLMAGLPMVASDLPEIKRVVQDGEPTVGELFDPFSSSSIVAAVRRVLDGSEKYDARCAEARRLAAEKYNWGVEERRLLALYDSLLRHQRGPKSDKGYDT